MCIRDSTKSEVHARELTVGESGNNMFRVNPQEPMPGKYRNTVLDGHAQELVG